MKANKVYLFLLILIGMVSLFVILIMDQKTEKEKPTESVRRQAADPNITTVSDRGEMANITKSIVVSDFPTSNKATPTVILDLKKLKDAVFQARERLGSPDGKDWNDSHTMNLTRNSVWYEIYSKDGEFIKKLPRYINVDPTGNPENTDYCAGDIQWKWLDGISIIGVQEINYRDSLREDIDHAHEYDKICLSCHETTISAPDGARIYLLKLDNLDIVYELQPPELAKGLAIHLDGITQEGYVSLSGASPIAYHNGNIEMRNEPKHIQYLGVFQILDSRRKRNGSK